MHISNDIFRIYSATYRYRFPRQVNLKSYAIRANYIFVFFFIVIGLIFYCDLLPVIFQDSAVHTEFAYTTLIENVYNCRQRPLDSGGGGGSGSSSCCCGRRSSHTWMLLSR
jgi:hypothetical protein